MTNKRILITGATGLIGRAVHQKLFGHDDLFTTSKSSSLDESKNHQFFDLNEVHGIRPFLDEVNPDIVIHSAAITSVDYAELHKVETERLNVEATAEIAKWCDTNGSRLVYFSTDFVFDGRSVNYQENDPAEPLSWYGKTKKRSEDEVKSVLADHVIIRPVLVYGYSTGLSRLNFPLLVMAKLNDGQEMKITADQIRKPTYIDDVADATVRIATSDYCGILHLSGPEELSIYAFAQKVAECFELNASLLVPVNTDEMNQAGRRPIMSGFKTDLAKQVLNFKPLDVMSGLQVMRKQLRA